jgi:hypothetical protein
MGLGHESSPTFLTVGHETNVLGTVMETVKDSKVALTRNAKRVGLALGDEAIDEQVSGKH